MSSSLFNKIQLARTTLILVLWLHRILKCGEAQRNRPDCNQPFGIRKVIVKFVSMEVPLFIGRVLYTGI